MTPSAGPARSARLEIARHLDEGPWSGYQKWVLVICAMAVILDGFDNQVLGFAIPALIEAWGVSRGDFPIIIAISLIAMSVGTACAGALGDTIGRRPALIGSVLTFGAATSMIALANDLTTLTLFRAIAALGLGGAMPNATALLAEFTPAQRRSLAVTLGIVCVPLGGLGGGLIAAFVLPTYGWRALFLIGGTLPLVLGLAMIFTLPESPAFLMRDGRRHAALARLARKLGIDAGLSAAASAEPPEEKRGAGATFLGLFSPLYLRDTIGLCLAFFAALLAVYSVFSWLPTLLASVGLDLAVTSTGLAVFNLGGVGGALLGAWLMDRFGSRWPMVLMAALGAVVAALIALVGIGASANPLLLFAALTILGAFIPGFQVMLFSLAALAYPTSMRASGVGAALAIGRLGAVGSSFLGSAAIGYGPAGFFLMIAAAMAVSACGVMLVVRHTGSASERARANAATRAGEPT
jgi:AAHS family 4-hydroxybenzoate transporter-like MFS transporter